MDGVVGIAAGQRIVERGPGQAGDAVQRIAGGDVPGTGRAVEPDRHPGGCGSISHAVVAAAADDRIRTRTGQERIIAEPAVQRVGAGPARQRIVVVRPDQLFDRDQRIARGIAGGAGHRCQADRDARQRVGIACRIGADPAVQHVRARPAHQRVVAGAARQCFIARRADQQVGKVRSDDLFDILDDIARGIAARTFGHAVEIDRDRRRRGRIIDRVDPRAAIDAVGPGAADDRVVAIPAVQHIGAARAADQVVAGPAIQRVGSGAAGQGVVERAADNMLDALQHVALGITALPGAGGKVDIDRRGRARIVGGIDAVATVQRVGTGAADQRVVAIAAIEHIVARTAVQGIVIARSQKDLDPLQHIAIGIAAGAGGAVEVDIDRRRAARIVGRVGAVAADQRVRAGAADQRVVAIIAIEHVGPGAALDQVVAGIAVDRVRARAAGQRVIIGRPEHLLDVDQDIAGAIAGGAGQPVHAHRNPGGGGRIIGSVHPGAAIHRIGPGAAHQRVVAIAAQQAVVAAAPIDQVVARAAFQRVAAGRAVDRVVARGADDMFDPGQHVTRRPPAGARRAVEPDVHRLGAIRIIDRVGTRAAIERVGAVAGIEHIVARAAIHAVGACRTVDRVGQRRADDMLDVDQHVALGIAADAGGAVHVDGDPGQRAGIIDRVEARAAIHRVGAGTADQGVVAIIAIEHIVAAAARNHVVAGAAMDRFAGIAAIEMIVVGAADQLFDIGQGIALGIAADAGGAIEIDRDRARRSRIVGGIDPRSAIHHIRAGAADQGIVAGAALQRVIARTARNQVVARTAGNRIIVGRPAQRVVVARSDQRLDIGQGIALRLKARTGCAVERDGDRPAGARIVGGVGAGAAIDRIGAHPAIKRVVAGPAQQRVIARAAVKGIVARRSDDHLDVGQDVAIGIAARAGQAIEIDHHRRDRGAVIDRVDPGPAVDHVGPATTDQRVVAIAAQQRVIAVAADDQIVAGAAFQQIVVGAAGQGVIIGRSDQVLDAADLIAIGIAANPDRAVEAHLYRSVRPRIIDRVEPVAADQRIRAQRSDQRVVAIAAVERFRNRTAAQGVVIGGPDDVFDADQGITLGIAAGVGLPVKPDIHRLGRSGVAGGIDAQPAVEHVGPGAADQRVAAVAAIERVVAVFAVEQVVAKPAIELFIRGRAGDGVAARRPDDMLDAVQRVARGLAALRDGAVGVDIDRRVRPGIVDRVEPVATHQRIGAKAADQGIVTRPAFEQFGTRRAIERVVERAADHMFDMGHDIALRIAADPGGAVKMHADPRGRGGIVHRVIAGAAVDRIGPGAADDRIIAAAAAQHIVARAAVQAVIAGPAFQRIRPGRTQQRVIAGRSDDVLDVDQDIALGIAAMAGACGQIDQDRRRRR